MDLWSRLIGGTGSSPTKHQPANSPAARLAAFKRNGNALQQIWRTSTPLSASHEGILTYCRDCLQQLNSLLDEESTKPAPYLCLLDAASSQIYIIVTKLAISSQEASIFHASARFFNILINGETDGVLDSKVFARALVELVRRKTGNKEIALDEGQVGDLVELLFAVTTKIRLDPDILPAWFYPAHSLEASGRAERKAADVANATRPIDFPLFYLLVDHVYKDGRTGDFARTGLLYLTDTASRSQQLERWMIESDLAMLMASGLGALYSRLSPRLPSTLLGEYSPPVLALSDWTSDPDDGLCSIDEFRHSIDAFLQYLLFWQDTLDHCQSIEVKDTLLDHFQILFLQQVLYPSLLESSDASGGSTAAVITYLCHILESLDNPDLVRRILEYLLASKPEATVQTKARKQRMSMSRRKSFDALTVLAKATDDPSPDWFNIVDFLVMSLKSTHAPTVAASLKLIAIVQQRHHMAASTTLVHTYTVDPQSVTRELSELNVQLKRLMNLAAVTSDGALIDQSYRETLKDALELLDTHCCVWGFGQGSDSAVRESYLTLADDDLILVQLNTLLACFFSNDTITNLALTEAITALASCPATGLNGWLLPNPQLSSQSTFMSNLEGLMDQVRHFRMQIPEWDALIAMHRLKLNDQQTVDEAVELASGTAQSNRSLNSTRPSSLLASDRQSIEVPRQSSSPLRRAPPRTLYSEGFGSLDESLSSSPALPAPSSQQQAIPGSPGREKPYLTPPSGSPSSYTPSCSTSTAPDGRSLGTRLVVSPLLAHPNLPRHKTPDPTSPAPDLATGKDDQTQTSDGTSTLVPAAAASDNYTSTATTQPRPKTTSTTASLSHVLVNAVILQEFILEVAAVVQTRACLFGEVRLE